MNTNFKLYINEFCYLDLRSICYFFKNEEMVRLSPTQANILKHLRINANKPVKREELAIVIWGPQYNKMYPPIDLRNIDQYISRLKKKLWEKLQVDIRIEPVTGIGYILLVDEKTLNFDKQESDEIKYLFADANEKMDILTEKAQIADQLMKSNEVTNSSLNSLTKQIDHNATELNKIQEILLTSDNLTLRSHAKELAKLLNKVKNAVNNMENELEDIMNDCILNLDFEPLENLPLSVETALALESMIHCYDVAELYGVLFNKYHIYFDSTELKEIFHRGQNLFDPIIWKEWKWVLDEE